MYFFVCYHIYEVSEELKLNNLTEVVRFLIWLLEVLDRNLGQALATLTVVFVVFYGLKQTPLFMSQLLLFTLQIIIYYCLVS
jgi:hypothetical protein